MTSRRSRGSLSSDALLPFGAKVPSWQIRQTRGGVSSRQVLLVLASSQNQREEEEWRPCLTCLLAIEQPLL